MSTRQWISRYTVTAAPETADLGSLYDIEVDRAPQMDGTVKWAVRWNGRSLHRSGRWDWEPIPSSRTDRWLKSHRFELDTALKLAEKAAPQLVINGRRPDGTWAERVPAHGVPVDTAPNLDGDR